MKNTKAMRASGLFMAMALAAALMAGCGASGAGESAEADDAQGAITQVEEAVEPASEESADDAAASAEDSSSAATEAVVTQASLNATGILDTTDLFTERDLAQTADLSEAQQVQLQSGQDVTITEAGVYVVSGEATDVTIYVDAASEDKVQLVLDGASISNSDAPAIYVLSADKVFITTTEGTTSTFEVTGTFVADGDTNLDAVIFSKDDLVLNGLGTLQISSTDNGVTSKDDLKVTGGTYVITAGGHALEGKDSVLIADGQFTLNAGGDGVHSENDEDATKGSVLIAGGTFDITAGSDGVDAAAALQVDAGTFSISAPEGLEGTYVQVNGGTVDIAATDDGINATAGSTAYEVMVEITGGDVSVSMSQGDTDAIDSNGSILISGGTVDITAQSPFDYITSGQITGGTVIVNGQQVTQMTNQMMGGMGMDAGMEMGGQVGGDPNAMGGAPGAMGGPQGGGAGGPMGGMR